MEFDVSTLKKIPLRAVNIISTVFGVTALCFKRDLAVSGKIYAVLGNLGN